MPVSLNCPTGHRLTVSRRYAGKLVRCPKCGEKVRIPPLESIEPEEESAEPAGCATAGCATVAMPAAAHLPLRRIANRHGGAPLKRLMAACATLAK